MEPREQQVAESVPLRTGMASSRVSGAPVASVAPMTVVVLTDDGREKWDKKIEFLLAVIGFAVDLGNVWRFPYICYRNGGGAFLIPYTVMLMFGGLPLFYLELAMGQYYRCGCLTIWKNIFPIFKGIGYAICILDLYMAMYYNTVIAWALYYLVASLASELPWTRCDNPWNTATCRTLAERANATGLATSPAQEYFERRVLQIHLSDGIDHIGGIRWPLALCLFAVFVLVYFSLWKGVRSTGKAVWVTATMPYAVLLILLLRGVTLDGSLDGIKYYLYPQWDKLLSSDVWIDAATQIFFSLGPGFGTLLALSSYNKFHNNCYRDALVTSIINCLTSFLAGFVIFSVLGYMAHVLQKDIEDVATDGPGLVFIVYPEAIATMKGSVFWSILFFLMLITLGLDSTFGGLEAMLTGLCDEYPLVLRRHREIFVGCVMLFIYACALPTTTYGGNYIVSLLDNYATATGVLFIVFVESMVVCWFYGTNRFSQHIKEMLGHLPGLYWRMCWSYISPLFLFMMFLFAVLRYKALEWEDYKFPAWSISVGWLLTASSICFVPGYIVIAFLKTRGTMKQRLIICLRPHSVAARKLKQSVPTSV
ncbi:sodium-dependent serotonin transporter [Rhipicephalus sanguineus]|nr:sodium-dependent serotonin transporter [Rhipicephalus sanguineus]